jgi:hypothetical protein
MKTHLDLIRRCSPAVVMTGLAAVCCCCTALTARAQYQVRNPGDSPQGANLATTQAADRPVGFELYGNNANRPVRYPTQTAPLPSETRMAIERSGALPSEIRMQAEAVGPLSPNGPMDYVPALSPLQRALGVTPPVLWGPAWDKPTPPAPDGRQTQPLTPAQGRSSKAGAGPAAERSPQDVTPSPIVQQPFDARLQNSPLGPANRGESVVTREGVVTRRLYRPAGPPTTRPTTNPSLADQPNWTAPALETPTARPSRQ